MSDDKIQVQFGADTGELTTGTETAQAATEAATTGMSTAFKGMAESVTASMAQFSASVSHEVREAGEQIEAFNAKVSGIHKAFAMIGEAVMVGFIGEQIYELTEKTAEYGHEVELAAQKTGMSTDAVQEWGVASKMAGGSMEGMIQGLRKFSQEIVHAEEGQKQSVDGFNKLGIAADDLKGMKIDDLMLKIADSFKEHADGANKDALAVQMFGRAGLTLIPILNLGREGIQQYKEMAHQLGAVMSKEDVESSANFAVHLRALGEGMEGMRNRIGISLMPALFSLATAFTDSSKKGGQLDDVAHLLTGGITVVAQAVSYASEGFQILGRRIGATAAAMSFFVTGHFSEAKSVIEEFNKDFLDITKSSEAFRASLSKPVNIPKLIKEGDEGNKPKPDFATTAPKEKNEKAEKPDPSNLAQWQEELEKRKEAERDFYHANIEEDLTFWKQKLIIAQQETKKLIEIGKLKPGKKGGDELAVETKIYNDEKQLAVQQTQDQLAKLKEQESDTEKSWEVRKKAAQDALRLIAGTYKENSKEYESAVRDNERLDKEYKKEKLKIAEEISNSQRTINKIELGMEQDKTNFLKSMGSISDEEAINRTKATNEKMYQLNRQELEREINLSDQGAAAKEKAISKLAEFDKQHARDMAKYEQEAALETNKYWKDMYQSISSSMQTSIKGMLSGTMTFAKAMKQLTMSILESFVDMGMKMASNWVEHQLFCQGVTKETNAANTASTVAANTTSASSTAASGMAQITTNAGVAASGAASSQASIPYIGPILAAVAAAAMLAMVLGFKGNVKSAAGGYDIPAGVNPVTQLHAQEMVLPAHIANPLRNALAGGGGRGGNVTHVHNWQFMDSKGLKSFVNGNASVFAGAVEKHARNFGSNRG